MSQQDFRGKGNDALLWPNLAGLELAPTTAKFAEDMNVWAWAAVDILLSINKYVSGSDSNANWVLAEGFENGCSRGVEGRSKMSAGPAFYVPARLDQTPTTGWETARELSYRYRSMCGGNEIKE